MLPGLRANLSPQQPAMPPQARKRPGAALPVRKPAKGGHIGMVAELVAALQRTFSRHRNSKDAADMTRYVSLG